MQQGSRGPTDVSLTGPVGAAFTTLRPRNTRAAPFCPSTETGNRLSPAADAQSMRCTNWGALYRRHRPLSRPLTRALDFEYLRFCLLSATRCALPTPLPCAVPFLTPLSAASALPTQTSFPTFDTLLSLLDLIQSPSSCLHAPCPLATQPLMAPLIACPGPPQHWHLAERLPLAF
jgi:hypothetical protein